MFLNQFVRNGKAYSECKSQNKISKNDGGDRFQKKFKENEKFNISQYLMGLSTSKSRKMMGGMLYITYMLIKNLSQFKKYSRTPPLRAGRLLHSFTVGDRLFQSLGPLAVVDLEPVSDLVLGMYNKFCCLSLLMFTFLTCEKQKSQLGR